MVSSKIIIPVAIGVSLCSVTALLIYVLFRKDDEDDQQNEAGVKFTKRSKNVPQDMAAAIIGRGGSKIKELEQMSGARINMVDSSENTDIKICTIQGNPTSVEIAENLIDDIIEQQKSIKTESISVPHWAVGKIIGKGGDNINLIARTSGAKVNVGSRDNFMTNASNTKNITITGSPDQINLAKAMLEKTVSECKERRETEGKKREPRGAQSPKAESNADLGTKGSHSANAPPAGSSGALLEVFVSAVSSPSRFWLQIVGPQVDVLDNLVDMMTDYYSSDENRSLHKIENVQVGQLVAAIFRHDGKWYRAKVMSIKPNEFDERQQVCDMFFVDYGDNEYVAMNELCSLRTDMLKLRFQAVECFLAGVAPVPSEVPTDNHLSSWTHQAIERFEDLTQVAKWKRLWSRTCTFKKRPKLDSISDVVDTSRNVREGSPIPGVKLYDTKNGVDVNIGEVLIEENWATEIVDEEYKPPNPVTPTTPVSPLPPTFGDLECSRVLGMVIPSRDDRASSLPHGGSSPSQSPTTTANFDDAKMKSLSLATGIDFGTNGLPSTGPSSMDMSYPKPETNGVHLNGSASKNANNSHQNGDFLNAERGIGGITPPKHHDASTKQHPVHVPDPNDEIKAKINRVESHHGSLEAMGKPHPVHVPDPKEELKAKINRVESHHGSLEAMGKQASPLNMAPPSPLTREPPSINQSP